VLERIAGIVGNRSAALVTFRAGQPAPRFIAVGGYVRSYGSYIASGLSLPNPRVPRSLALHPMGFGHDMELCTEEELAVDQLYQQFLRPSGIYWTAGTIMPVPTGDLLVLETARDLGELPHTREEVERLDPLRPHLARAALLAHRLGLRAARAATEALEIIGLPAAVLHQDRTVVSANGLFEALAPQVRIGAFDRLTLATRSADALLGAALADVDLREPRSIPLPATASSAAIVGHIVPLRRAATDIFTRGDAILICTVVSTPEAPLTELLTGLFDLTPSEARVARGISIGQTLAQIANGNDVSRATVRNQLKAISEKTGTRRQVDLAILLSGLRPPRRAP
jgi:DNA-binding CsgD family transcriptional regulator